MAGFDSNDSEKKELYFYLIVAKLFSVNITFFILYIS